MIDAKTDWFKQSKTECIKLTDGDCDENWKFADGIAS